MENTSQKTTPKAERKLPDFLKPPTSVVDKANSVFSERFVRMNDKDYYLRVFTDGSGEFTRFDVDSMKWVHLLFPAA
jgi:hypothetical protein